MNKEDDASRFFLYIFFILSILFLSTCNQPTEVQEGGPGIIIPGVSVEGIKLGYSKEAVEAKLGKPTSVGWADGQYRGWRLYSYSEGDSRDPNDVKLEFYFIDNGDDYGPLDWIGIHSKYKGKTREGVGIGTTLEKVHQAYGLPAESILSERNIIEKYCLNRRKLEIHYNNKDSLITGMSIGYFVLLPQDNPCK